MKVAALSGQRVNRQMKLAQLIRAIEYEFGSVLAWKILIEDAKAELKKLKDAAEEVSDHQVGITTGHEQARGCARLCQSVHRCPHCPHLRSRTGLRTVKKERLLRPSAGAGRETLHRRLRAATKVTA